VLMVPAPVLVVGRSPFENDLRVFMIRVLVFTVGHLPFVNDVRVRTVPLRAFTNATRTLDETNLYHGSRNGARAFPDALGDLTVAARGSVVAERALVFGARGLEHLSRVIANLDDSARAA